MKMLQNAAVVLLFLSTAVVAQAQTNVAVMGATNSAWLDEVAAKLEATGRFTTVDVYDLTAVTPTLAEMQAYCGILAFTDNTPVDPVAFGDNLADYVDSGGGVVVAVFATASIPIVGRFQTDNYYAIQPTDQQDGGLETMGTIYVPTHPVLAGVTSFSGGTSSYRPSGDSLHPAAIRIADWTGPETPPLIAERTIGTATRIDLGFYPPSDDSRADFWDAATDGDLIMANALEYVCNATADQSVPGIPTLDGRALAVLAALLGAAGFLAIRR